MEPFNVRTLMQQLTGKQTTVYSFQIMLWFCRQVKS